MAVFGADTHRTPAASVADDRRHRVGSCGLLGRCCWGVVADAVTTDERVGSHAWLLGDDRPNSALRSYRLPDDADQRSIALDYGRELHDDGWQDIVIQCDGNLLWVSALKRTRVRLIDSFTMKVSVLVSDGVFLKDHGDAEATLRCGGRGVSVSVTAPPVNGDPRNDIEGVPPSVVSDSRCGLDSITGEEGDLLPD